MAMRNWQYIIEISNRKKVGTVWLVIDAYDPSKQGYFKFSNATSKRYSGPTVVNEYLSYLLGKELGLPMADTELANIDGKMGIVSIRANKPELLNWDDFTQRYRHAFNRIVEPKRLVKMFVFDTWIANIDRNNRNIILYPLQHSNLYDFYLIDHGLTLLGAFQWKGVHWRHPYWDRVAHYNNRYLKTLPEFIRNNTSALQMSIRDISSISETRIKEMIDQVPVNLITRSQKKAVYQFLVMRKYKLSDVIRRWLRDYFR
jgi:hypothetical protein